MAHQPKVDEYYDHNGTIARVVKVRTDDVLCEMSNGQRWAIGDSDCGHEFTRVRVVPVKPERTLTMSQGLAWMKRFNVGDGYRHLVLSPQVTDDGAEDAFAVTDSVQDESWYGPTPCKAIIAARKALKQVGK